MPISYPIETESLIFKKPVFEDWKSIYQNVWRHVETAKYMLWSVTNSEEEAQERMRRSLKYQNANDTAFFVYEKSTGECIGFAGITEVAPGVFEDTGIALGPQYVRKGYGTQIVRTLMEMVQKKGGHTFLYSCRSENMASVGLQKKSGFVFDHSEQRIDQRDNTPYQLNFYKRTLTEI